MSRLIVLVVCCLASLSSVAFAQETHRRVGAPRDVITLAPIDIQGRVQHPGLVMINRNPLSHRSLELRTSFVREVARTTRAAAF